MRSRPWTAEEKATLVRMIGVVSLPALAKLVDRSQTSVEWQCRRLGLGPKDVVQGHETVTEAARRLGVSRAHMCAAVRFARVHQKTLRFVPREARTRIKRTYFEIDALDSALAAYRESETMNQASARIGVHYHALSRWLTNAGYPRAVGKGRFWRIDRAIVDAVVAAHFQAETLNQAAARLGIWPRSLARRLRKTGIVKGTIRYWELAPAVVDDVVAQWRAECPRPIGLASMKSRARAAVAA